MMEIEKFKANSLKMFDQFQKLTLKDFNDSQKLSIFFAGIFGSGLLILMSQITFFFLVEISLNEFFSVYFAFVFFGCSAAMFWRIETLPSQEIFQSKQPIFKMMGILLGVAGICCLILEKRWVYIPFTIKVPFYIILGIIINFAGLFSIADMINILFGLFQHSSQIPLIDSYQQIVILILTSILSGSYEGFFFGAMNIESMGRNDLDIQFSMISYLYLPFLLSTGFIAGVINEILRIQGPSFTQEFQIINDPFTDQI